MKKSVEILGLPVISITEGRELGMSKTLLIDAKKGTVAAITIEDEDWYRGVKLIPYESVIAIGDDAVTVTNSENILTLDDAGDYEQLLDDNIRIIGTKAITKSGSIQGKISELYIGDDGKIEKCEITAPDGTTSEVTADQISIFGKQVTVIDPSSEKKNEPVAAP
ncbi:MAG: PRC-barrel domain-containing protein, partial [Selenomonas bovis]|nr:PRC-barrel domain-containing protein [Selenomonas bovis]